MTKTTEENTMENKQFVRLNRKFNNRSHAQQLLEVMEKKELITNYRISWDTQLRMVVEVVYKGDAVKKIQN